MKQIQENLYGGHGTGTPRSDRRRLAGIISDGPKEIKIGWHMQKTSIYGPGDVPIGKVLS